MYVTSTTLIFSFWVLGTRIINRGNEIICDQVSNLWYEILKLKSLYVFLTFALALKAFFGFVLGYLASGQKCDFQWPTLYCWLLSGQKIMSSSTLLNLFYDLTFCFGLFQKLTNHVSFFAMSVLKKGHKMLKTSSNFFEVADLTDSYILFTLKMESVWTLLSITS